MPPSPTRRASPPRRTSTTRSQSPTRKADITDLSKKFGELETMWKDTLERSSTPRRRASRSSSMRRLSTSGTPSRNVSRKNSMVRRPTPTPALSPTPTPTTEQGVVGKSAADMAEAEFLERAQGRPPRPESSPDTPPPTACWKCGLDLTTAKVPPKFCRECGSRLA